MLRIIGDNETMRKIWSCGNVNENIDDIACNLTWIQILKLNWIEIHLNSIQSLFGFLLSNANQIDCIQLKRYRIQLNAQGIRNMLIISIKNWHWICFSKIHFHSIPFKTKFRFKIYLDSTRLLMNLKTCLPYANFNVIIVTWIKQAQKLKVVKSIFIQHLNAFDSNMFFALKIMNFCYKEHGCIILQYEVVLTKFCQIIILFWKIIF